MYSRQRVRIELNDRTPLYTQAYIVKPAFTDCLEASEWDFEAFLKYGKANFQKFYKGFHSR